MRCLELIEKLEALAPPVCACEWDNIGLLAGRGEKEICRVLIALDATEEAVEEAVRLHADLLLTHHPLIFKPLKRVNDEDFISRRLMKLIRHDVNYYAMHTNFDAAPGCMADIAAARLSLTDQSVLAAAGVIDAAGERMEYGIGKAGRLPFSMSTKELAFFVKDRFGLPFITVYGECAVDGFVQRAAIVPGSGKDFIAYAKKAGAEALISGDIGHHAGMDAAAGGLAVLDAGHYGLEHIFVEFMADYLAGEYGGSLKLHKAAVEFPASIY